MQTGLTTRSLTCNLQHTTSYVLHECTPRKKMYVHMILLQQQKMLILQECGKTQRPTQNSNKLQNVMPNIKDNIWACRRVNQ